MKRGGKQGGVVLGIVKARLNRPPGDTLLDDYLNTRIEAARLELAGEGIRIDMKDVRDQVFLADTVVWHYQNRDVGSAMPNWLRRKRRERWLQQQRGGC